MALPRAGKQVVRDVDKGWKKLKHLVAQAKNRNSYVKVGVLGNAKKRQSAVKKVKIGPNLPKGSKKADSIDNVTLAMIHEFGSPAANVPERSWIRSTFDLKRAIYIAQLAGLISQVYVSKMTIERALGIMGAVIAGDIKKRVRDGGIEPHNTPEVFMRKLMKGTRRFNATGIAPKVLIETGRMVASVAWQVILEGRAAKKGD